MYSAGNVPNEVKNMIADKLPYSLPDVNRGQYGNFELKNVRLIRFDYASASVSMENTKVTVQLNDAVLEFIGFVRAWYNIVLEFSSRGDFKVRNHKEPVRRGRDTLRLY